ncbi:MAG: hypothetical protein HKN42_10175 [Granulosicoccus sp.]|nr:hypothetical protein [Granulosicoccus sp.]
MSKPEDKDPADKRFWRAMQKEAPAPRRTQTPGVVDLTADLSSLSVEELAHRRRALRSMLAASEARQQQVLRSRLPALTQGLVVRIKSGKFKHRQGTVVDADYIRSRVLLNIQDEAESQWLEFARITAVSDDDSADTADESSQ